MRIRGSLLTGLATFEAAANYGSFTQAATHLHITTGAISQQIRQLEQQLNFPLFERHSRGIRLTEEGHQLYKVVNKSLKDISTVINLLQSTNIAEGEVHLKITPSFAFKWLVPRLQDFYNQYPDIKVQTFAEGALVDHSDNNFDLAIDYGQTPYPNTNAQLLIHEQLLPVMSPDYMAKFDWQSSNTWRSVTLLHDAMPWRDVAKDHEWRYWFDTMKIDTDSHQGHFFNRTDMAMAAAAAGLGVAMARRALVEDDFANGTLISPFEPINANAGYYLIQHHHSNAVNCFKEWLVRQVP